MLQEQISGNHPANYPALGQPIDELALAEIKGAIFRQTPVGDRQGRRHGDAARLVHGGSVGLARPHRAPLADGREGELRAGGKRVYYLSLEFLIGRLFTDALNNLQLMEAFERALRDLGVDFGDLQEIEPDAALGNGGLGRLAACFMESMASLAIPAIGYGIRYEHGLFRQTISHGWQQEFPEWLSFGNPWEFERFEVVYDIHFGGHIDHVDDRRATRTGSPLRQCRPPPSTRQSSAGAARTSTRCGCGRRARSIRCSSTSSTTATIPAQWPRRRARNRSGIPLSE